MFTKITILAIAFLLLAPLSPVLGQEEAPPTNTEPAPEQPAEQSTDQSNTNTDSTAESPAGTEGQATDEPADSAGETESQATEEESAATQISEEAIEDQVVTEEDLDAKTPGAFHFVKRAVRAIQGVVTRDPVKKAELKLEAANEELLRIQKIAEENPDDEKIQAKTEKALEKFEKKIEKIKDHAEDIKEKREEKADEFLKKMADMQIKQQKMLDNFEESLPEEMFAKIKEAKNKAASDFGETLASIESDPEKIASHFDEVLQNQRGSEFKEFKNMEVLERVLGQVPPQAREAIARAKEHAQERFAEFVRGQDNPELASKFKMYVSDINGEAIEQMKVLDNIKLKADLPDDFFKHVEAAKAEAMTKFEEKFRKFSDPASREKLVENLKNGDVESLRVFRQIQENMPADIKVEIAQHETQAIQKFKEKFTSDSSAQERAEKFRTLSQQLRENPDPTTFAAIEKLREELPAEQRAFVDSMENQAKIGFEEKFKQEQGKFLERIKSFDPQTVGVLNNIQEGAPPELRNIINQAISKQVEFVKERLENIANPAQFERFKERIEDNPELRNQIQFRTGNFANILQNKEQEIQVQKERIEQEFRLRIEEEGQRRGQDGQAEFSSEEVENLKQRFFLQPQFESRQEMQKKFEQEFRQEQKNLPRATEENTGGITPEERRILDSGGNVNERRFEPKEFEPGQRGEIRREEVRPDSFNQIPPEIRQEVKQEFRQEIKQEFRQEQRQDERQELKQEIRQEFKEETRQDSGGSSGGGQIFTPAPSSNSGPSPDAGSFSPSPAPTGDSGDGGSFSSPSSGDGGAPPPPPPQ